MIIKRVSQVGDPMIRRKAKPVRSTRSKATQKTIRNLIDSMRYHGLIGMAAPQIGEGLRIFVTELQQTRRRRHLTEFDPVRVFVNPRIVKRSKKQTVLEEGCGSLARATLFGPVRRPSQVTVKALDEHGTPFTLTARGLLAKVIQHELDHLNGTVILDKFVDTRKAFVR